MDNNLDFGIESKPIRIKDFKMKKRHLKPLGDSLKLVEKTLISSGFEIKLLTEKKPTSRSTYFGRVYSKGVAANLVKLFASKADIRDSKYNSNRTNYVFKEPSIGFHFYYGERTTCTLSYIYAGGTKADILYSIPFTLDILKKYLEQISSRGLSGGKLVKALKEVFIDGKDSTLNDYISKVKLVAEHESSQIRERLDYACAEYISDNEVVRSQLMGFAKNLDEADRLTKNSKEQKAVTEAEKALNDARESLAKVRNENRRKLGVDFNVANRVHVESEKSAQCLLKLYETILNEHKVGGVVSEKIIEVTKSHMHIEAVMGRNVYLGYAIEIYLKQNGFSDEYDLLCAYGQDLKY